LIGRNPKDVGDGEIKAPPSYGAQVVGREGKFRLAQYRRGWHVFANFLSSQHHAGWHWLVRHGVGNERRRRFHH